jgi:hypothetical protein
MKTIVLVKQGRGGSGASRATRYISRRDRDEAREGSLPRKLFSEKEDKLGFFQANRALGAGEDPKAEDVLHLVISLEKEDDFHRLGADEESRQRAVRETMRGAMKQVAEDLKTDDLRWVAGIHRNTDNPHVHLLIHRDYTNRETGRVRRLKTLPKEMRVSWEKTPDGERIIHPGSLSKTFEMFLEKQIERTSPTDKLRAGLKTANAQNISEDRLTLGRAMIAEEKIERLTKMRDDAVKYGRQYRYEFANGGNRSRGFSEHDIHKRAWAKANQATADAPAILTPEERRQMREEIVAAELKRHEELITKHRETRNADLTKIELQLARAIESSQHLITKAATINSRYEAAGTPSPVPIIPRAKLSELQDRAIERGDTARIRKLEEIRVALAAESGSPARTDGEIGRLRAQLFVAQSSLTVEQESAKRFEESKHLLRWDLSGAPESEEGRDEPVKRSLTQIERALAWEQDQAKFIGARRLHWDDDRRREAQARVEELSRQRESLLDRIEAERAQISNQAARKAEIVATLHEIFSKEEHRYRAEGREMPAPLFSMQELKELDTAASRLRDPEFHRTLAELEREYDARTDHRELSSVTKRAGRAVARVSLAEISLRESELNLERFNERRELIDVIVKDDGGRNIAIARLADVDPPAPLEQLFRPLIVPDNRRSEIAAAVEAHGQRLLDQHEKASASYAFLIEEARAHEEDFSRAYPGRPLPTPRFTHWEISKLELHAARETDPSLKAKYEALYGQALENPPEDHSRRILIEKDADGLLDPVSRENQSARNVAQFSSDHSHFPDHSRELSFER